MIPREQRRSRIILSGPEEIKKLQPIFRDVLLTEGTNKEIAAALNINIGTVKSRRFRALAYLALMKEAANVAE